MIRPAAVVALIVGVAVTPPLLQAQVTADREDEPTTDAADRDQPYGSRAAFGVETSLESVIVLPYTPLRTHPDRRAARLAIVTGELELPVLAREGSWVKTRFRDLVGWLAPEGEPEPEPEIPLADEARDLLVVDTTAEERAARVARARAQLDGENREWRTLGPWPLHTDVVDDDLLSFLDRVASDLPGAYERRFGLAPKTSNLPVVVLFAKEASYRRYADASTEVANLDSDGHASHSLAALYAGGNSRADLASVVVHELTHLLNRSVYPIQPPTWLEEGLANDLGIARIAEDGTIEAGTLGGVTLFSTRRTRANAVSVYSMTSGGRVVWAQLLTDWKTRRSKLLPLPALLDLSWAEFVARDRRANNYALATFLVRFLLDEGPDETAEGFRTFLRRVADGDASDATALSTALGMSPERLEALYGRWLTSQVAVVR